MQKSVFFFPSTLLWTIPMLLKVNIVIVAGEVKMELLCLHVQIWMDLKICDCW
jgi:hypothetical protein